MRPPWITVNRRCTLRGFTGALLRQAVSNSLIVQMWSVSRCAIAGFSADPKRIAELEAYEARSVPADARKPFLGSIASIRQNQRIATNVLPRLDRWIAAHETPTARR